MRRMRWRQTIPHQDDQTSGQAHDVHHRLPNLDDNGDDKVGPGEADKLDDDDCVVLQNEKECEE